MSAEFEILYGGPQEPIYLNSLGKELFAADGDPLVTIEELREIADGAEIEMDGDHLVIKITQFDGNLNELVTKISVIGEKAETSFDDEDEDEDEETDDET